MLEKELVIIVANSSTKNNVVGIFMFPSRLFVASALGVLYAGQVIAPISVDAPSERILQVVRTCGVKVILTTEGLKHKLDAVAASVDVIVVDEGQFERCAPDFERHESSVGDPAYILQTSGTSGKPKAIAISHRNVLPLLLWQNEVFVRGRQLEHLLLLPLTFDFGLQDLLVAVMFGGCLNLRSVDRFEPQQIADRIRDDEITSLYCTPSMLEMIVPFGPFPAVDVVLVGGETLSRKLGQQLVSCFGEKTSIYNGYGPTEASINCLMYCLSENIGKGVPNSYSTPIGYETGLSKVEILDDWGQIVPVGVPGEIVIGGPGVCDGYVGVPVQQDRRFRRGGDGFGSSELLYLTGDYARRLESGEIEFLGRRDGQVKIRGHRVEISEVEAALEAMSEISVAAVLPAPYSQEQFLIGIVKFEDPSFNDIAIVRSRLNQTLPPYLIPRVFIPQTSLPITVNGKLDRVALSELAKNHLNAASKSLAFTSAGTDSIEQTLLQLWQKALNSSDINLTSDLFEAGADSLLISKVHSKLSQLIECELPISAFFDFRTVGELANFIATVSVKNEVVSTLSKRTRLNSERRVNALRRLRSEKKRAFPQ